MFRKLNFCLPSNIPTFCCPQFSKWCVSIFGKKSHERFLEQLRNLSRSDQRAIISEFLNTTREVETEVESEEARIQSDAGNTAYENLTAPKRFPKDTSGEFFYRNDSGESVGKYNILYPLQGRIFFPDFPNFHMKVDVDSVYAYNKSLEDLLRDCGSETSVLMMPSITVHSRTANGSRFFVDTRYLADKPLIRGSPARKVGMEKFPNVYLGKLTFPRFHRPLDIYLFNIAAMRVSKVAMFTKVEMAVINAALNMARELSKIDSCDKQYLEKSFMDFHTFKSCYGDNNSKAATNDVNEMTTEEMTLFSSKFMCALAMIAGDDNAQLQFWRKTYHQIRSDKEFTVGRREMVEAAKELSKGAMYVATLPGVKKGFNLKDYQRDSTPPSEFQEAYKATLLENEEMLVKEANDLLLEEHEVDDLDELPEGVLPFTSRTNHQNDDNPNTRELNIKDINSSFPSYEILFGIDYEDDKKKHYNNTLDELTIKVDSHLKLAFPVRLDRTTSIFFDVGVEVRLRTNTGNQGNNSLLLNVDKAYTQILQASAST